MPMVFFFLAGSVCLLLVERHQVWWVGAIGCWGLALMTKLQLRPFWTLSLLVPGLLCVLRRERRITVCWQAVRLAAGRCYTSSAY